MQEPALDTIRLVPVKFRMAGKHYDFHAEGFDLHPGDRVIVETDRGRAMGTVVFSPREVPRSEAPDSLKSILRLATSDDLAMAATSATREKESFRFCVQRIQERKMEMKLVRAEYLFDASKIIFYFTADGRVDFRELVKDLAHHFHTRIEMRQIGVRDEAKLTGGIGICGRELCCCTFLNEFAPVSVKMAKEQGLALNPNKISGQCGRLLCCLGYEFETYCALKKGLPKCGRRIELDGREVEVIDQNVLGQKVTVRQEDGKRLEISAEQLALGVSAPVPAPVEGAAIPPAGNAHQREIRRSRDRRQPASKPAAATPQTASRSEPPVKESAPDRPQETGNAEGEQTPRPDGKRRRGRRRSRRR